MRKWFWFLLLVPALAFGAEISDAVLPSQVVPPDAVLNILSVIQGLPYVGPVLVELMKWIAIIAPIMTALSFCVQAVLAVPEIVARYHGAQDLADKIKYYSDKINYWLAYLSIRNAQKPKV